jgi:hypothetical protein
MVSNLCCDPLTRLFFREFAPHLLTLAQRHENGPDRLGRLLIARPDVKHCGQLSFGHQKAQKDGACFF